MKQQQGGVLVIGQLCFGRPAAHYALHMIHEELQVICESGYGRNMEMPSAAGPYEQHHDCNETREYVEGPSRLEDGINHNRVQARHVGDGGEDV